MYVATYIIDITALILLIGMLHSSTALNSRRKKPFLAAIILTVIIILSEVSTIMTDSSRLDLRSVNIFSNILGFSLTPLIPIVITLIFDERILTTHRLFLIPTLMNIIATVLSPLFGFIFYLDGNNQYFRGDFFLIFIAVYMFNFLYLVFSTADVGKKYNYPIMWKLTLISLFTILGTSVQLVEPRAYTSWHCVTLAMFLYFLVMSEFDSSFDTLTALYNRSTFERTVMGMMRLKAFSVIILDINDFKIVNDTYGHDYGDRVLKIVASVMRRSFGKQYRCFRYGGDEFSIISRETDQEKIEMLLQNMTRELSGVREDGNQLPSVSYGYCVYHGGKKLNFHDILKEADEQMYRFKKANKIHDMEKTRTSVSVQEL